MHLLGASTISKMLLHERSYKVFDGSKIPGRKVVHRLDEEKNTLHNEQL